jgi:ABC-type branched-subunit amino acid transport system permease subunit
MSHATLMRAGLVLLLLTLMAVAPVLLSRDLVTGLFLTLLFITLAANYDILGGFLGYVNLGQGAFFGLGAYLTFTAIPAEGLITSYMYIDRRVVSLFGYAFCSAAGLPALQRGATAPVHNGGSRVM